MIFFAKKVFLWSFKASKLQHQTCKKAPVVYIRKSVLNDSGRYKLTRNRDRYSGSYRISKRVNMASKLRKLIKQQDYIEILREVFSGYNTLNWYLGFGKYKKLMRYCDFRLDYEPQNARIYLAELFAECEVDRLESLLDVHYLTEKQSFKVARRFADKNLSLLLDFIAVRNKSWTRTKSDQEYGFKFSDDCRTLIRAGRNHEYDCDQDRFYEVPIGVQEIAGYAFESYNYDNITIPETVEKIAYNALQSVFNVDLEPGNRNFYMENGCLFERAKKRLLFANRSIEAPIRIPDWLEEIDEHAISPFATIEICHNHPHFHLQDGILISKKTRKILYITARKTSICVIPDGVPKIPPFAFMPLPGEQSELVSVTIPDSIYRIENRTFFKCSKLKYLTLSANLQYIGERAFLACTKLEKIYLPQTLRVIDEYAFTCCDSLTELIIPAGVTMINYGAFRICANLKRVIILSEDITIKEFSFAQCPKLETVVIQSKRAKIHKDAFKDCPNLDTSFLVSLNEE